MKPEGATRPVICHYFRIADPTKFKPAPSHLLAWMDSDWIQEGKNRKNAWKLVEIVILLFKKLNICGQAPLFFNF